MSQDEKDKKPVVVRKQRMSQLPPPTIISFILDGIQRLICLGLATWHFLYTSDVLGTLVILAAGFIDARIAKTLLIRVLRFPKEEDE